MQPPAPSPPPSEPRPAESLVNVPNLLSAARLPLAVVLFACIVYEAWFAGLVVFLIATATDWLDGWWARRYGPLTLVGRNLDPIADKVLVCGAFIYLIPVPGAGILPWMVTVVVCREVIVTGGMRDGTFVAEHDSLVTKCPSKFSDEAAEDPEHVIIE